MTPSVKVLFLTVGALASAAKTSVSCSVNSGGHIAPDDNVSLTQTNSKSEEDLEVLAPEEDSKSPEVNNSSLVDRTAQPGQEMPAVCFSTAWSTGFTTGAKCNDDAFNSVNVEGEVNKHGQPHKQGPLADSAVCNAQSNRYGRECSTEVGKASNKLLPAYSAKYRRDKYGLAAAIEAWDPRWAAAFSSLLPAPFDDLTKIDTGEAQTWETTYLKDKLGAAADPAAHWFEVPLNPAGSKNLQGIGRLYSTRVPRNIGEFSNGMESTYQELQNPEQKDGELGPPRTYDYPKDGVRGAVLNSDALTFKANKELKDVNVVVSLIIDSRLENKAKLGSKDGKSIVGLYGHNELAPLGANSEGLWEYYSFLGLEVLRCPINDFNTPNTQEFVECIERIAVFIANGKNVVVHCFGGSGRTGTIMMGVAKALGVPDVISWSRTAPGKDTYLDVHEQELFIDQMPRVNTRYMQQNIPPGILAIVGARFDDALKQAQTPGSGKKVADCKNGEKIVMQDKCWMFGNCRGCMGEGNGRPGSYPRIHQTEIHLPLGDERAPARLSDEGKLWYNYWSNTAAYFPPTVYEAKAKARPVLQRSAKAHILA